jgi:hypothetical protein
MVMFVYVAIFRKISLFDCYRLLLCYRLNTRLLYNCHDINDFGYAGKRFVNTIVTARNTVICSVGLLISCIRFQLRSQSFSPTNIAT